MQLRMIILFNSLLFETNCKHCYIYVYNTLHHVSYLYFVFIELDCLYIIQNHLVETLGIPISYIQTIIIIEFLAVKTQVTTLTHPYFIILYNILCVILLYKYNLYIQLISVEGILQFYVVKINHNHMQFLISFK